MALLQSVKQNALVRFLLNFSFKKINPSVISYRIITSPKYLYFRRMLYYIPQKKYSDLKLSDRAEQWMKEIKENGIVKIENEFEGLAEYLDKEYFSNPNCKYILEDQTVPRTQAMGITLAMHISFRDSVLAKLFFHEEILGMLSKHYKCQAYYRNLPSIIENKYDATKHTQDMQALFHLDKGLDQISIMFLVKDLSENDTHMQYSMGSNKEKHKTVDRFKFDQDLIEKKYPIMKCIGKAGTVFIFRAGMGFHRGFQVSGSTRKILHLNVTSGHDLFHQEYDKISDFNHLENKKFFVKKSIEKIVK